MKKLILLLLVIGVTSFLVADGYDIHYTDVNSSEKEISFSLEDYNITTIQKNDKTFSKVDFEGNIVTNKAGYAELPYLNASIQISNLRNVTTAISYSNFTEIELDHPMLPSRGTIYRNQDPTTIPYKIAAESLLDEFYPAQLSETTDPFIIRDVRGVSVYVFPFQYNPVKNILRVYTDVTITIRDNNSPSINPLYNTKKVYAEMDQLYRSAFINYEITRFENEIDNYGAILVIYTPRDADAIVPYVDWKREMGYTVYEEEVSSGTNVESTIQNLYDSHNDILYVQLVGDWLDLSGSTSGGAPTDPLMGCVIGTDIYPDIIVGRFSASDAGDVTTQVNKAITYERDPDPYGDWYHKGLGIGSEQGAGIGDDGEPDYEHIDIIKNDKYLPFTYTEVAEAYQYPSLAQVSGPINDGLSVINYCGHGSSTSWVTSGFSNSDVNNLTNGDALPFIISVACVNGAFHSGECFAEAWLKKSGGGAVGMYASTVNQSWAPPMRGQDYIADLLIGGYDYDQHPGQSGTNTDVQKITFGSSCINGSILMTLEEYSGGSGELQHWTIFGDASVQMRTDTPAEINLSNETLMIGIDYTTTISANGSPVEGAMLSLIQDDDIYTGVADANGEVNIVHDLDVGNCTMVVTGFNLNTIYNEDFEVIPNDGPYVTLESYDLIDGNNNIPEFDESITMDINVENVGSENANNVVLTLSTEDAYITITDDEASTSLIQAGSIIPISAAFSFDTAANIPDQHAVDFWLIADGDEGTWESNFTITFNAPAFEAGSMIINDYSGDGILDPGESATISIPITNIGSAASPDLVTEMTSASPDLITIVNSTYETDGLGVSEQTIAAFDIEVADDAPVGNIATLTMMINSGAYNSAFSFFPSIGMVMEDFETGDFSMFDWEMGQNGFEISSNAPHGGDYCAVSEDINNSQTASISVTMDVASDGEISFYRKVSSESSYDYLRFYINGAQQDEWSGTEAWSQETYEVTAGTDVEFKWAYEKDYSVSSGSDCAWIDDIEFPAVGGGDAAIINVSVDNIEFEDTGVGETSTSEFTIFNLGNIDLTGSISAPAGFTTDQDNYTVEPGSNLAIQVEFSPTEAIEYSGDISITSNDANQAEVLVAVSGTGVLTGNDPALIPAVTELTGNYPNPFNPSTNIKFSLKADSKVSLMIYNVRGQKVKTLISDNMEAGYHTVVWNGRDDNNKNVSSGIYFSRFDSNENNNSGRYTSIKKMILMK